MEHVRITEFGWYIRYTRVFGLRMETVWKLLCSMSSRLSPEKVASASRRSLHITSGWTWKADYRIFTVATFPLTFHTSFFTQLNNHEQIYVRLVSSHGTNPETCRLLTCG
jgi:hypothetical protein